MGAFNRLARAIVSVPARAVALELATNGAAVAPQLPCDLRLVESLPSTRGEHISLLRGELADARWRGFARAAVAGYLGSLGRYTRRIRHARVQLVLGRWVRFSMSTVLTELKQRAAQLSESERAELALALIESLDGEVDAGAEEAWRVEIERRIAEIDRGDVQLIPGDEVFARLRRKLG